MDRIRHLCSPFKSKTTCESVQSDVEDESSRELSGTGRLRKKVNRSGSMEENHHHHNHNNKDNHHHFGSLLSIASSPSLHQGSPFKKLTGKSPKKVQSKSNVFDLNSACFLQSSSDGVKLTNHQRELVREAWHLANKKKGNAGIWIFKWLFVNHPFLKDPFYLQSVPDDKLEENEKFLHHASVFSDVIEMIVDSMEALDDSLGPLLLSYGSKHVLFEQRHGFKPEYWNYFACAMCEYASQSWKTVLHKNDDTLHAWRILVYFLVSKVKEGYYLEKERVAELEMESVKI